MVGYALQIPSTPILEADSSHMPAQNRCQAFNNRALTKLCDVYKATAPEKPAVPCMQIGITFALRHCNTMREILQVWLQKNGDPSKKPFLIFWALVSPKSRASCPQQQSAFADGDALALSALPLLLLSFNIIHGI